MTALLLVLLVLAAAVAASAVFALRAERQRLSPPHPDGEDSALQEATEALAAATRRIAALEAEAVRLRATPPPAAPTPAAPTPAAPTPAHPPTPSAPPAPASPAPTADRDGRALQALWTLTGLEQARVRRYAEALSTAAPSEHAATGLGAGLEDEVARLRDDSGTPGTLRVSLDAEPAPGDAELLLRSVQALLAVLSRHCQAYDLYVHEWEERLLAVLVCEGFDGPESVGAETTEIRDALLPVGGRIELDRDVQGRLRARLSLPARH